MFVDISERIACYFNAVSNTNGKNLITLLALKKFKKMAENRELEFTKDLVSTRKKYILFV
jgi:hypothetical protein